MSLQPFNFRFFCLLISVDLNSVLPYVWLLYSVHPCLHYFIYFLITYKTSALYMGHGTMRCKHFYLLITATFAGRWIEIHKT